MTDLINPHETAKRLGISTTTLRRMTKAGRIPAVRLSRRTVRYEPVAIEAFIAKQRDGGEAAR